MEESWSSHITQLSHIYQDLLQSKFIIQRKVYVYKCVILRYIKFPSYLKFLYLVESIFRRSLDKGESLNLI